MRTIYKYTIPITPRWEITMPRGAEVRHVREQNGQITVWVELNPQVDDEEVKTFFVVGTGHEIPDASRYLGSAFVGYYVWHIYTL